MKKSGIIIIVFCAGVLQAVAQKNCSFENVRPTYNVNLKIKEKVEDTLQPVAFTNDINDSLEFFIDSVSVLYKNKPVFIRGYSVMVYNGLDVNKAKKLRSKVLTQFPDQVAFLDYEPPNTRLKVGQFRNKLFAQQLKQDLASKGFQGLIIVPEKIKVRD